MIILNLLFNLINFDNIFLFNNFGYKNYKNEDERKIINFLYLFNNITFVFIFYFEVVVIKITFLLKNISI